METEFFTHPFWALLIFGFLVCPRILLLALWWPVHGNLGAVIAYPVLSYFGWVLMPRLTLACIFAGYYWNTNQVLAVLAFALSLGGEGLEKKGMRKLARKFTD